MGSSMFGSEHCPAVGRRRRARRRDPQRRRPASTPNWFERAVGWGRVLPSAVDVSRRIVLAVAVVAALVALIATESAIGVSDSELVATADACPGSRSLRVTAAK